MGGGGAIRLYNGVGSSSDVAGFNICKWARASPEKVAKKKSGEGQSKAPQVRNDAEQGLQLGQQQKGMPEVASRPRATQGQAEVLSCASPSTNKEAMATVTRKMPSILASALPEAASAGLLQARSPPRATMFQQPRLTRDDVDPEVFYEMPVEIRKELEQAGLAPPPKRQKKKKKSIADFFEK